MPGEVEMYFSPKATVQLQAQQIHLSIHVFLQLFTTCLLCNVLGTVLRAGDAKALVCPLNSPWLETYTIVNKSFHLRFSIPFDDYCHSIPR